MGVTLIVGLGAIAATVFTHFAGIMALSWILRTARHRYQPREQVTRESAGILFVVFFLLALHFAEITLYALVYFALAGLPNIETALYFSMACFTTIGFGDIVIEPPWRLLSTIEGANGLILFAWSAAFLTTFLARIRSVGSGLEDSRGDR